MFPFKKRRGRPPRYLQVWKEEYLRKMAATSPNHQIPAPNRTPTSQSQIANSLAATRAVKAATLVPNLQFVATGQTKRQQVSNKNTSNQMETREYYVWSPENEMFLGEEQETPKQHHDYKTSSQDNEELQFNYRNLNRNRNSPDSSATSWTLDQPPANITRPSSATNSPAAINTPPIVWPSMTIQQLLEMDFRIKDCATALMNVYRNTAAASLPQRNSSVNEVTAVTSPDVTCSRDSRDDDYIDCQWALDQEQALDLSVKKLITPEPRDTMSPRRDNCDITPQKRDNLPEWCDTEVQQCHSDKELIPPVSPQNECDTSCVTPDHERLSPCEEPKSIIMDDSSDKKNNIVGYNSWISRSLVFCNSFLAATGAAGSVGCMPSTNHSQGMKSVVFWDVNDVTDFISSIPDCEDCANIFKRNRIDGATLPFISEDHLLHVLNIRLGPAIKLQQAITALLSYDVNNHFLMTRALQKN